MNTPEQPASNTPSSLFVGREPLIQSLHATLTAERVAVLTGAQGSGKTALAREYARRFAHQYRRTLWLDAMTPESLLASVLSQGQHFALPPETIEKGFAGIGELIEEWAWKQQDALLVLDNVLFPADMPQPQEQRPPGGHVLLIGRDTHQPPAATCLPVKALTADEGALLLLRQAGLLMPEAPLESANDEQQRRARELARELAGSPLALTLAGGYLQATNDNIEDYLFAYRDCPERPDSSSDTATQILEVVCDLTLARLAQFEPATLQFLQISSLLSPCTISYALFQQENLQQMLFSEGPAQLHTEMQTLQTYRLLEEQDEGSTFRMHPLLQATIGRTLPQKSRNELGEQLLIACQQLALNYEKEQNDEPREERQQNELPALCCSLAGHIRFLSTACEGTAFSSRESADAYVWAASLLGGQGLIREAEPLLSQALEIWERTVGDSYPGIAGALLHLAIFHARLEQYNEAEAYAHRAITTTTQILGINHFRVLDCLNTLADIYRQQSKFQDAASCYQKASSIGERVGLKQHRSYITARKELARLKVTGRIPR